MDMKRFFLYAISIAALALAGCGGGGQLRTALGARLATISKSWLILSICNAGADCRNPGSCSRWWSHWNVVQTVVAAPIADADTECTR